MTLPLSLVAGDRDLSQFLRGSSCSNSDPGGFETLTLQPDALRDLVPGKRVAMRWGLDYVWDGIVNEPAQQDQFGRVSASVAAVGRRVLLQRDVMREIYVDRDLSKWGGPSTARQIALVAAGVAPTTGEVAPDDSGAPSIVQRFTGQWDGPTGRPDVESSYASNGIPIGSVYYAWTKGPNVDAADANWFWAVILGDDDVYSALDTTGNLRAAGPGAGTITATTATRMVAVLQHEYLLAAAGSYGGVNTPYEIYWPNVAVFGRHGLTKRGAAPEGFYTEDIFRDAVTRASTGLQIVTGDSSAFTLAHCVYLTDTRHEQIALDMAGLMGWHYGVWEPDSTLSDTGRAMFIPTPTTATCTVFRTECDDMQEPTIRYDKLYNTCRVSYTDTATGRPAVVTVSINNELAQQYGVTAGTLPIDGGLMSSAAATTLGTFALQLAQNDVRGQGSATLPLYVRDANGALKPSCLLKSGRDRIRIPDLPAIGSRLATGGNSYDTFLIRRVETNIDDHGLPRTQVQFDQGADLLTTLQNRLAVAATIAGATG